MKPEKLLADAAWQIKNGFLMKFPEALILMCYYHVSVKVDDRIKKEVKDEKIRQELKSDFHQLQLSQNLEVFKKASELFLKKYRQYQAFTQYFRSEWLEKNPNWFEGASELTPSTQCAQESTHAKIKQTFTHNERTSMNEMKDLSLEIVNNFSLNLKEQKPYELTPKLSDKDLQAGYEWLKLQPEVMKDPDESNDEISETYWVTSNSKNKITNRKVKNAKEMQWTSFDEFKTQNFIVHKIEVNKFNLIKVKCSCEAFLKNFKCLHSVAISINMKFITVPREVKQKIKEKISSSIQLPNNNGRPRGRPKKAEKALIKQ